MHELITLAGLSSSHSTFRESGSAEHQARFVDDFAGKVQPGVGASDCALAPAGSFSPGGRAEASK
jgi:hypothetical protein